MSIATIRPPLVAPTGAVSAPTCTQATGTERTALVLTESVIRLSDRTDLVPDDVHEGAAQEIAGAGVD